MDDKLPKAKEFANELLRLVNVERAGLEAGDEESELLNVAACVAKHVIATKGNSKIMLAIEVDKLSAMKIMALRYSALLAEVGVETPKDREFLEQNLDKRIAGGHAFATPLIVPGSGRLN